VVQYSKQLEATDETGATLSIDEYAQVL